MVVRTPPVGVLDLDLASPVWVANLAPQDGDIFLSCGIWGLGGCPIPFPFHVNTQQMHKTHAGVWISLTVVMGDHEHNWFGGIALKKSRLIHSRLNTVDTCIENKFFTNVFCLHKRHGKSMVHQRNLQIHLSSASRKTSNQMSHPALKTGQ